MPHALGFSSALPHAGDWLNGVPSAMSGLHFQDQEFWCCLCNWLGVPPPQLLLLLSRMPQHSRPVWRPPGGLCGTGSPIWDIIFSVAQSAALAPSKEMPNLILDSSSRPADVFLPIWSHGEPAVLDVQVISNSRLCLHSGPCLAGQCWMEVGLPPLSLQVDWLWSSFNL